MKKENKILIIDCGSQYTQLIARRVRELGVYSEILFWDSPAEKLEAANPSGIILSGGPRSVLDDDAPAVPVELIKSGVPVLGICYGMQLLAHTFGGVVERGESAEYGRAVVDVEGGRLFSTVERCVDEPLGRSQGAARGLPRHGAQRKRRDGGLRVRRRHGDGAPVPPRSRPHAEGAGDTLRLPLRHLRLQGRVDARHRMDRS